MSTNIPKQFIDHQNGTNIKNFDKNSKNIESSHLLNINGSNESDNGFDDLSDMCDGCLYIKEKTKTLDRISDMNFNHSLNCKVFQNEKEHSLLDQSTLSQKDLELLNEKIFNSIANTQLQSIISTKKKSDDSSDKNLNSNQLLSSSNTLNTTQQSKPVLKRVLTRTSFNFSSIQNVGLNQKEFEHLNKFEKYFKKSVSTVNLRMQVDGNDVWKYLIKRVEPFLDVYSLLILRQTCKCLYYYKYKLRSHNTLSFTGFAGFDSKWIFDNILPLIHHILDLPENAKIKFDFTGCVLLKDISTVYLLRSNMLNSTIEMHHYARNVREIIFDFCHQITDKSLEVMLTTKLPSLQRLSLKCCRNENFTGLPFVRDLTSHNWPRFTKFRCTFSNLFLEPMQTIADFIYRNAYNPDNQTEFNSIETQKSLNETNGLLDPTIPRDNRADHEDIEFEICGSWGSRRLIDKLGFGIYCSTFTNAVKANNCNLISKLTKKIQSQLIKLSEQPNMIKNNCVNLLKNRGSELLVNCPITVKDRTRNVGIWTLPILIAIDHQNMEMFDLLVKRGARLNVWDSMKKSPLTIACDLSLNNFVSKILKFGLPPIPYDNVSSIPLLIAISNSNIELVKLLITENFEINYKCPSIKNYKSPLYVACEHYNPQIIRLLLEYGADPNWKYRHRSTPTLLGYQQDPKILETFLDYGAGATNEKRWVLVQVMACAIVKNDFKSVELLIWRFPDLVEREHEIWSKPIIAVSKLNRIEILEMLLNKKANVNTFDSYGTTALHTACEEANMESIKILLNNDAKLDVQDVFGRTPLHLAIMENKPQVVSLLLEKGAKLDLKEYSYGETPLMTAIRTRNENIAQSILKTGRVEPNIVDYQGKNVSYYLQFYKMSKLETYLNN